MSSDTQTVRVLYISHAAALSGAEYSLLELIDALGGRVEPIAACPPGPLAEEFSERGVPWHPIHQIDGGARLHPRHTAVALRRIGAGARMLRHHAHAVDLVHGNMVRAGLIGTLAAPRRVPLVVHVRDAGQPTPTWAIARRVVGTRATALIANSRFTAESFAYRGLRSRVHVVPSPVDLRRFDRLPPRAETRAKLGVGDGDFVLGVVGQLAPIKGQDTAIEAVSSIRERLPASRLVIVGSAKWRTKATTHDNDAYVARLHALAAAAGDGVVVFAGERDDVPALTAAFDVALVPSWHEPWGRTVIEAMAAGTPVIASAVGGPTESIENGRTGLLVPPRDARALADAIAELATDPERRAGLAEAARADVGRWDVGSHADQVYRIYAETLGRAADSSSTSAA